MSWKRWIHEVRFVIRLASPLHIGAGEEELMINDDGHAVIPGSSLAGAWRAYAESQCPTETVNLFGRRKEEGMGMSNLYVHDLVSDRLVSLEERPAVRIDGALGTADDKGKFERIYVAAGERFRGKVVWTADDGEQQTQHLDLMKRIFSAWHHGLIRLGKYKSTGAGRVEIVEIRYSEYDCWTPEDYFRFLSDRSGAEPSMKNWGEDASLWFEERPDAELLRFRLTAELESPLLVRGNDVPRAGEPDVVSIRNVAGQYLIPGSSWKGALRHHMEKIARYYDVPEIVDELFGYASQNDSEGKAGAVITSDALIQDVREADYAGIRIDRLTGSVMTRMLRQERTVRGSAELQLDIQPERLSRSPDLLRMSKGLLLLAFRDLAEQGLTLGGGYASGRGRLRGTRLVVQKGERELVIDFEREHVENRELVDDWISTLARRRTG